MSPAKQFGSDDSHHTDSTV